VFTFTYARVIIYKRIERTMKKYEISRSRDLISMIKEVNNANNISKKVDGELTYDPKFPVARAANFWELA
jgi:hypothetical protein